MSRPSAAAGSALTQGQLASPRRPSSEWRLRIWWREADGEVGLARASSRVEHREPLNDGMTDVVPTLEDRLRGAGLPHCRRPSIEENGHGGSRSYYRNRQAQRLLIKDEITSAHNSRRRDARCRRQYSPLIP